MSALLADTSFFVAYLNPRDEYHTLAVEWMTASSERIITSEWVLSELANYFAESPNRRVLGLLVRALCGEDRELVASVIGLILLSPPVEPFRSQSNPEPAIGRG